MNISCPHCNKDHTINLVSAYKIAGPGEYTYICGTTGLPYTVEISTHKQTKTLCPYCNKIHSLLPVNEIKNANGEFQYICPTHSKVYYTK